MLLDERPLVLLPSLAKAVGVNEAIAIQQLHFHAANPDNGRVHNGERWIFKTYCDWHATDFPFWSERTIRRTFLTLEKKRLIVSCQPEGRDSRRKYYRIDYEELEKFHAHARAGTGQLGRLHAAKSGASSLTETTRTETTETKDTRAPALARTRETRATGKSSGISWEMAKWHQRQQTKSWKRFASYCRNCKGTPTLRGFMTWFRPSEWPKPKPEQLVERLDTEHLKYLSDEDREDRLRRRAHVRRWEEQ